MRLSRALTLGLTLVALTAVGACGSSEDGGGNAASAPTAPSTGAAGDDPADPTGPAGSGGLPKASDPESIASYVNRYTPCQDVATGDAYDTGHDGDAWGTDESEDPAWAIEERAVCTDGSGRPIALLTVPDMKKFQAAAKASGDKFLVGENFAVVPVAGQAIRSLQRSDLRFLACDADLVVPSGFEKKPALVDGCVLTDHFGD
ncbi:hypothetical protein [Streptomyces sp. LUP30]|uniref:hypothetical protein n=1 Tax=Streptomyces sp. LUP30 TaxID=1890285 RepID=UPI000851F54D|nr:hypothetical protein [Streptomyces sp. LUP30]